MRKNNNKIRKINLIMLIHKNNFIFNGNSMQF